MAGPAGKLGEVAEGAESTSAVARLFAEHNASLIRFLRLRLNSDQDAREVAQEAYARLLQLDQPGAISFLRSYLFRVAANIASDRLRHNTVCQNTHVEMFFPGSHELSPERSFSAREQMAIVEASLMQLPKRVRDAFLLQRLNGFSASEVARRLGLNERTARHYIAEAMLHCRKRLDEALGESAGKPRS
jgi:RNA polymerase sigma-70 factor (ECF subfamily)